MRMNEDKVERVNQYLRFDYALRHVPGLIEDFIRNPRDTLELMRVPQEAIICTKKPMKHGKEQRPYQKK